MTRVKDEDVEELTDLQLMIFSVLWRRRGATVGEVFADIRVRTDVARKTIATVLTRLERRGLVTRSMIGREASYNAVISRKRVMLQRVSGVLGALFEPALHLSRPGQLAGRRAEVERLRALLHEAELEIAAEE